MATYIQGVTDYIPELQPFQPDYNMMANILQTKQSRYDAAHKKLSSVYGTLLNSPLLRQENIEARDEFFRSIDQEIKRMSGIDLSLQQNQSAAMDVFKGFYEDKNLVKDMMWTKNYMNEIKRAEAFRDCVDPKKCGGSWWEGGIKALNYKAQEFKSASQEEALNFSDVIFTPAQDFTEEAMKFAKDSGFNVKFDQIKGDWIVTTKNGKEMIQPLADFYLARYGNDPKITQFYKTQAYVNRMDWVTSNAANYADQNEANMAYMNNMLELSKRDLETGKQKAEDVSSAAEAKSQVIDKTIKNQGFIPHLDWLEDWQQDKEEAGLAKQTVEVYDQAYNNLKALGVNKDNIRFAVDNFDSVVGFNLLKQATYNAAEGYASLTQEVSIKENPYAVQARQQAYQTARDKERYGYFETDPLTGQKRYVPGTEYEEKRLLKEMEMAEAKKAQEELSKNLTGNYGRLTVGGQATTKVNPDKALLDNVTHKNELDQKLQENKKLYVKTALEDAQRAFARNQQNPKTGASLLDLTPYTSSILKGGVAAGGGTGIGKRVTAGAASPAKPTRSVTPSGGINSEALLRGDADAVKQFEEVLQDSAALDRIYSETKKQFSVTDSEGFLNSGWISPDTLKKLDAFDKDVSFNQSLADGFSKWTKKQSDTAYELAEKDMFEKAKDLDEEDWKEGFDALMTFKKVYDKASVSGFIIDNPDNPRVKRGIHEIAAQRYENYEKARLANRGSGSGGLSFGDALRTSANILESTTGYRGVGKSGRPVENKSTYQFFYDQVAEEYKQGYAMWREAYSQNVPSWTNPKGGKATDDAGLGYGGLFDSAADPRYSQANADMLDMYRNYQALSDEAKVYFGGFEDTTEKVTVGADSDSEAKRLYELAMQDMMIGSRVSKEGFPADASRVRGKFEITPIAASNPNLVGYRITLDDAWANKYRNTETKFGSLTGPSYQSGITVYLPKDKMQSEFLQRAKYDDFDFMMDTQGRLDIENPVSGKISVIKDSNMYRLEVLPITYTETGEPVTEFVEPTYHDLTLDLAELYKAFSNNLDYNAMLNRTLLASVAKRNATDPSTVLPNQ